MASDEFNPALIASDSMDYAGSPLSRMAEAVTTGIGTAAISGSLSIYNTFRDYEGKEMLDTYQYISDYDSDWANFYQQHQQGVDTVGFIAGSFIPGSLGVKALKMAQAGEALGAIGRGLNLANSRKLRSLSTGLEEVAKAGGSISSGLTSAKRAQLGWSVADNVLTSAAAELAIVGTMHDSPIFEGDDFWDFSFNVATGAALGGVIGGALDHWAARGVLKSGQKAVEKNRRLYDTIFDPSGVAKLSKGDEVLNMTESILKLETKALDTDFDYTYLGKKESVQLKTADAFTGIRARAEKSGFDTLAIKFNELAGGDESVGQAAFSFIRGRVAKLRSTNESTENIIDEVQGYLQNLKSIRAIDDVKYKIEQLNTDATQVSRMYMDLETGSIRTNAVLTAADLKDARKAHISDDAVQIGNKRLVQQESRNFSLKDETAIDASARYMWAERLAEKKLRDRTFLANDFALLDRLSKTTYAEAAATGIESYGIKIKTATGEMKLEDISNLREFINRQKIEWLEKELGKQVKGHDLRELAAHVNQSTDWVEKVITGNFKPTTELLEASQDLRTYFRPKTVEVVYDFKTAQIGELGPRLSKFVDDPDFVGPSFQVTAQLAHHYNLQTNLRVQNNAVDSVLGAADAKLLPDAPKDLAKLTSERGAGASALGAANANFGDVAENFVQYVGKIVATLSSKNKEETIQTLAPYINAIRQDPNAAAELGILTTALRRDSRRYFLDDEVSILQHAADDAAEEGTEYYRIIDTEVKQLMARNEMDVDEAIEHLQAQGHKGTYETTSKAVYDFLKTHTQINTPRVNKQTTLLNASGITRKLDADAIYIPPVDTKRYPYFAFVRAKERIGNNSDISMITAKSDDQLRSLASQVPETHEIIYKTDIEKFYKAKGEYDYSMQINDSQVNSVLQRRGILGDYFPETRAQNVLEDYVAWHGRQEESLVRQAVQVKYRQFFSEVGFLSDQFTKASTSMARGTFGGFKSSIADPFNDYKKTALNISKQGEYPLLDSLNEFVDKIGKKAYEVLDGALSEFSRDKTQGMVGLERANQIAEHYGLGTPYTSVGQYLEANSKFPKNLVKEGVTKVNSLLATVGLRLDFANSLVNIISTPIMLGTELSSIRTLIGNDSELAGKLRELTHVKIPGQNAAVPSTTQLIARAVSNYFGKDKDALLQRYRETGNITDVSRMYHEMLSDVAYMPNANASTWMKKIDSAVEKGTKITGNVMSEELTRFVSADVMRQLSEPLVAAGKLTVQEQNAFITSFVNRTQGNYLYSQRPVLFQGTTGAAISLFQTYSFNVMQQLLRHMENGDKKTMLTFAGLQSSLYGMNGLPFFDAVNTHLIGSAKGNETHADAYSALPSFNKELGDWMLYGTASAFPLFGNKGPALYSRGDLNPRHVSIIPINPMDIPAVDASLRLVDTVKQFGKNVVQGADVSQSMLHALEHQGWSRPLAGFAQLLAGQSTTNKGALVSASNELETTAWLSKVQDRMIDFGGGVRVLGAKPMDEALALNAMYRQKHYQAEDRAKIESLGVAVKSKLYNNQTPTPDELYEFMQKYQAKGGRIETFSSSLQHWMKDANTSVVNQMANNLRSPYSKKMQMLMGGENLEDYSSMTQPESE